MVLGPDTPDKECALIVKSRTKWRKLKMTDLFKKCYEVQQEFQLPNVIEPMLRTMNYETRFDLEQDIAIEWTRNYYKMVERR
jgi:hypothetical protein